jgi:hypothetical protein
MFSKHPRPWDPAAGRPSDDQLMELLRSRLREIAPAVAAGSRVDQGVLEGRGWSWLALPNHTGRPSHFDIGFTVGSSDVIADCVSGTGPLASAVAQVLDVWAATSAACFRQLVSPGSQPVRSGGIPGWSSVASDVIGYGADADALSDALRSQAVFGELGLTLPRATHNGIKVYLHKTPTETTGEVRVNGMVDAAASQALAAMDWPAVKAATTARFYAVAVHPE